MTKHPHPHAYSWRLKPIGVMTIVFLWIFLDPITAFFWTAFIVWWALRFDMRVIIGLSIIFVGIVPLIIHFGWISHLNYPATYMVVLLLISLVVGIERWRNRRNRRAAKHTHEWRAMISSLYSPHSLDLRKRKSK